MQRFLLVLLITFGSFVVCAALPQDPETHAETQRGITLFQQDQIEAAVTVLRDVVAGSKNDLRAWHYLGLALEKKGDSKEARKAHEKAALLGDQLINQRVDQVGAIDELNEMFHMFGVHLTEAAESAERYLMLEPNLSRKKRDEWQFRSESLRSFAEVAQANPNTDVVFKTSQVDVRPKILSKLEPRYTEQARRNRTTGIVILSVILGANGKVFGIQPVKTLPDGLTGEAFKVARQIKFVPGVRDGKPVSVVVQVEYGFHLY